MKHAALGMIETYGYIGALASADAAVKAAVVTIDHLEIVKGGIVTVFFTGDVGAVNAAVEAGEKEAKRVGNFRRSHVIARVSNEVEAMLSKAEVPTAVEVPVPAKVEQKAADEIITEKVTEAVIAACEADSKVTIPTKRSEEELMRMKVVKLRNIARSIDNIGIDRNRIKFSNKEELVNAILASYERG
jgi:energy-coupling factor transport system substrate-specific component